MIGEDAVKVWSPTGIVTAIASSGAFIALLGVIVRQAVPWRKQTIDANEKLIDTLSKRVDKLERQVDRERNYRRLDRNKFERRETLSRHKLNNTTQCLDALLLILETSPEKVPEAVAAVKAMREQQRKEEALELSGVHAEETVAEEDDEDREEAA